MSQSAISDNIAKMSDSVSNDIANMSDSELKSAICSVISEKDLEYFSQSIKEFVNDEKMYRVLILILEYNRRQG